MDTLKNQFARIQEQLNGLTASQKMLTAALVAIMVMTLVWWGKYAGDPEMEAVLPQNLSQEDIGPITAQLRADGIPYRTSGRQILVPAERRLEALGALGFAKVLPHSTSSGFDEMIRQVSPFASPSQTAEVLKRAREQALAEVIRHFPGVSEAFVMVDPAPRRQIGSGASVPSATVNIVTNGTTRSRQLAQAAADLVTGANAGLTTGNVKVIVDGTPQRVANNDTELADGQLENRQRIERDYQQKIADLLQNMGPVLIAVNAHVDLSRTTKSTIGYNKDGSLVLPRTESSQNAESSGGGGGAGGEPGVGPNTGGGGGGGVAANGTASVGGAGGGIGGEATTTESNEQTTNEVYAGRTDTHVEKGPGEMTVVSASVRVPRSYFVKVLKGPDSAAPEPDEKKLNDFIKAELASVRAAVRSCTGIKADEQLSVDAYYDLPLTVPGLVTPQLASSGALPFGLGPYAKQLALGGLALVSLFLVSMVVRKASPVAPVVAVASVASASPAPTAAGPALVDSAEPLAGEASGGDPMMAGMELDEESVRTRQMIDQVSTLVQENPDAAATLVKRWLNRG